MTAAQLRNSIQKKVQNILLFHECAPMRIVIHNIHMHQWGLRFNMIKKYLRYQVNSYHSENVIYK